MLLVILVRLWNQSRRRAASVVLIVLVSFGALIALDVGSMRSNVTRTIDNFRMSYGGDMTGGDASFRARTKLLQISARLFRENPLLGAGNNGWVAVVQESGKSADFADTELATLNQAHNQFANDIAKGGIVGGLAGLALLFVPLFLFARSRPFSNDPLTVPALAGVVTCVGFATIGVSESVLVLSLTSSDLRHPPLFPDSVTATPHGVEHILVEYHRVSREGAFSADQHQLREPIARRQATCGAGPAELQTGNKLRASIANARSSPRVFIGWTSRKIQ